MRPRTLLLPALLLGLAPLPLAAATQRGFELAVLVDGSPRPEYRSWGTAYVEALRGREYALRITNPLPVRVGVALSVDGLNTVDARRSDPASATKWILEPYQSIVVSGWQVSSGTARRFFFTGERQSYGAQLGQTDDLGVLEAVFFREKERRRPITLWPRREAEPERKSRSEAPSAEPPSAKGSAAGAQPAPEGRLSDDYAATGMGDRTRHEVERVDVDLETRPAAVVKIRYEYRPQLVRLGVLPDRDRDGDALDRREKARGFEGSYCPEPRGYR